MIEFFAALEATALAHHLRVSRWTYPLVNAGHILGIALLVGAVIPMDMRLLRAKQSPIIADTIALLRPFAITGACLAIACGMLLFLVQATDYAQNGWFRTKMALLGAAVLNAGLHFRLTNLTPARQRLAAILSLALWPAILISDRMIGFS